MSAERAPRPEPAADNRIFLVVGSPPALPLVRPLLHERARAKWIGIRERIHETWLGELVLPVVMFGLFIGTTLLSVELIRIAYTWKTEAGIDLLPGMSGKDIFPFLND